MSPETERAIETPGPGPLSWGLCCRACGTRWTVPPARILAGPAWMSCPHCGDRQDRVIVEATTPHAIPLPILVGDEPAFHTQVSRARNRLQRMGLTHRQASAWPRTELAAALCTQPGIGPKTVALVLAILDLGDPALLAALFAPRTIPRPSPGLTPLQRAVLTLRVQVGSSSPQVAAQLGLAIRRVRTIECSAAARLRRLLHQLQRGQPLTEQARVDLTAFGPQLAWTVPEQTTLGTIGALPVTSASLSVAFHMGAGPVVSHAEWPDSPGARAYQRLVDQSAEARQHGDHWQAQQLVSIAHRWALAEHTRLQRLGTAREEFARTTVHLQRAWDHDRSCATLAELRARHPEFGGAIGRWEIAQQQVRTLEIPTPPADDVTGTTVPTRGPG